MNECTTTRKCSRCGEQKPAEAFYGGRAACRACLSRANRDYYESHRHSAIARQRARERLNPWGCFLSILSVFKKSPTRRNANAVVRSALRAGFLVRPSSCECCGAADEPLSDGRSSLHAHHEDITRPLFVSWLCAKCHARADAHKWEPVSCPECGKVVPHVTLTNHQRIHKTI